jgi:hypothetical protein
VASKKGFSSPALWAAVAGKEKYFIALFTDPCAAPTPRTQPALPVLNTGDPRRKGPSDTRADLSAAASEVREPALRVGVPAAAAAGAGYAVLAPASSRHSANRSCEKQRSIEGELCPL